MRIPKMPETGNLLLSLGTHGKIFSHVAENIKHVRYLSSVRNFIRLRELTQASIIY